MFSQKWLSTPWDYALTRLDPGTLLFIPSLYQFLIYEDKNERVCALHLQERLYLTLSAQQADSNMNYATHFQLKEFARRIWKKN